MLPGRNPMAEPVANNKRRSLPTKAKQRTKAGTKA